MPNNILITPASASIAFSGSSANTIRLQVEDSGSVAFYGNSGSLFGIVDSLSGSLMSVNDVSGLPILEVFSDDRVVMGTLNQNTLVVTGSNVGIRKATPTDAVDISGSVLITGSLRLSGGGITGSLLGTASYANNADLLDGLNSTVFATTGSNTFVGNQIITGSFTVVTGSAVEFRVTNLGVNIGNITTDTHNVTGSLRVSGSTTITGSLNVTSSITENGSSVVTQADIGSGPNEIPLNQYLGTLAYQDATSVTVNDIVATNQLILPLTSSASPQTGSMFFSGSFLYVYTGTQYRSASLN